MFAISISIVLSRHSAGYSSSGESFNVPSEALAAECAARLGASKIVFFTHGESMIDKRNGRVTQSLRLSQAISLLRSYGINNKYIPDDPLHAQNLVKNASASFESLPEFLNIISRFV